MEVRIESVVGIKGTRIRSEVATTLSERSFRFGGKSKKR